MALLTSENSPLVNHTITQTLNTVTTMDPWHTKPHRTAWVHIYLRSLALSDFQQFVKEVIMMPLYSPTDFWPQTAFNTGMSKSLSRALKEGLNANYAFIHGAFFQHKGAESPENEPSQGVSKTAGSGWAAKKERKTRDEKIPKGPCPPRQPPLWPSLQGFSLAPGPPFGPPLSLSALHKAASHVIWGTKELTLLTAPTQWPPHWGLSSFNLPNDRFHPLSPDKKEEQELTHHLSLLPPFTSPPLSTPPKKCWLSL